MLYKIGFLGAALSHPATLSRAMRDLRIAEPIGLWAQDHEAEAAERFCRNLPLQRFDDPDALIDASDAVVITTETHQHKAYALRAIEQGRPVFVDKPFATCAADAIAMVEAARSRGVGVMSCSLRRYAPAFRQLADACRSGEIGQPISAVRFEPHGVRVGDWQDRPETSGGFIFNFGIHCVDCLVDALGPVEEVYTHAHRLTFDVHSHDAAIMTLRFASGATGIAEVIGAMQLGPTMATAPSFRVFGSEQSLEARLSENHLRTYDGKPHGVSPYHRQLGGSDGTVKAFVRMVETGEWAIPAEQMLEVMHTLEAARASAERRRPVALDDIRVGA